MATAPDGGSLPWISIAKVGLGRLRYEWNELDEARHLLTEGIRAGELWNSTDTWVAGHTALAAVTQAQGDLEAAGEALQEAAAVLQARQVRPDVRREWEIRKVRWWLGRGDLPAARRWVPEVQLSPVENPSFEQESACISAARVLIARREFDPALDLLARLAGGAEAGGRSGRLIEILNLQALALQAQGEISQALASLDKGLNLAEPGGYVRTFLDEGTPMAALLQQAARRGTRSGYVNKLLRAFKDEPGEAWQGGEPAPLAPAASRGWGLVEPLTARELELLQLVAGGLSNPQIAAELFIALGTVKSHIHNIYGKLNAQNRAQAVARAKELGLL